MPILNAQHLAAGKGFFEPQRLYNWSLEIALDDAGDQVLISQCLQNFELPKESNDEIVLDFGSEKRYVAGKAEWQASPLVLLDMVDMGVASAVMKWRRQVYNAETGSTGLARDYKKNGDLVLGAPDNSTVRIWKLIGLWPVSVDYGSVSMSESNKVMISVILRYDRAIPGQNLTDGLSGINVGTLIPPL